jgi:ParB family transcriptional regulator, chromosome partitioning protein
MSLKDKAARIDFTAMASPAKDTTPAARPPRTAPGQMMELAASQREDLVARVKELEAQVDGMRGLEESAARAKQLEAELQAAQAELQQWDGVKGTRLIPANDIVPSLFANRHALNFASEEFKRLVVEIKNAGGNIQPVKVRPLAQPRDGAHFELVFGHRRHAACLQLGLPVLALVDNVDDQLMFVEMDRENRARLNLSPWEQGVMYKRGLSMKLFGNMRDMGEEIGVHYSLISKSVALAELPLEIVEAFPSPMDLQYRWTKPLVEAMKADLDGILKRAAELKGLKGTLKAQAVFSRLVAEEPKKTSETRSIKVNGKEVAVVQITNTGVQIGIKPNVVASEKLDTLTQLIEGFLSQ